MQALVVEFLIKPKHVDAFNAAILENARASRETEPGCRAATADWVARRTILRYQRVAP